MPAVKPQKTHFEELLAGPFFAALETDPSRIEFVSTGNSASRALSFALAPSFSYRSHIA
jgi:hypothetical protein